MCCELYREFVNCVKCIRILSPQEVQQMSLDGDLGNNVLSNQACSSSDGGNAWKPRRDQNPGNPSIGFYDQFEWPDHGYVTHSSSTVFRFIPVLVVELDFTIMNPEIRDENYSCKKQPVSSHLQNYRHGKGKQMQDAVDVLAFIVGRGNAPQIRVCSRYMCSFLCFETI
jgi:hypothetical protein